MVCYDLAHQIRCAKHTFSGRCGAARLVGIAHHSFYSVGKYAHSAFLNLFGYISCVLLR